MDVDVPVNTTATIYIPADNADAITEAGKSLSTVTDIKVAGKEDNYIVLNVGSGSYHFAALKPKTEATTINPDEYIGEYKVAEGMISKIEVKAKEGKLILLVYNNSGDLDPVKGIKDQFSGADGSVVNFIRDNNGKVIKVKLSALGMIFEGIKQ